RDNSVLFSLKELRQIEEERVKQEEDAERARLEAERRAKDEAERLARDEAERKVRDEQDRVSRAQAERERQIREEQMRLEAEKRENAAKLEQIIADGKASMDKEFDDLLGKAQSADAKALLIKQREEKKAAYERDQRARAAADAAAKANIERKKRAGLKKCKDP